MSVSGNTRNIVFNKEFCDGTIIYNQTGGELNVSGQLKNTSLNADISFWAAAPPTKGISFSGSCMPYPSPEVAYDRTPNKGIVKAVNGQFNFVLKYPNAYYIGLGSLYIPPHINFKITEPESAGKQTHNFSVQIDDGIPFRMLTYPAPPTNKPRISPLFYCEPEKGARSQEAILRASSYPLINAMPSNFWGDRPPR